MNTLIQKILAPQSELRETISRYAPTAVKLSDYMAANPERSGLEYESSKKMTAILSEAGYEIEYPFCEYPTAFNAVLHNGTGPSVGILVEYDALPEIGHACGHNAHGSMAILAGLALAEMKHEFQGTLRVIGTPAEEENGAKVSMAERGVFDDLDLAVMIHSYSGGHNHANMALMALKSFEFTFTGENAHAAVAPWKGRNAGTAARKFLDLIDARRQTFMPQDRVNGIIIDGGHLTNIIPEKSTAQVEFRADTIARINGCLQPGVFNCAKAAALALDCEVKWHQIIDDFTDMVRIHPLEKAVEDTMHALGLATLPVTPPAGSSDMGNVSYRCPAIQPLLSITDAPFELHTTELAHATTQPPAHEAIQTGAVIMAALALYIYKNDIFRTAVKTAFNQALAKQ